MEQRSQPKHRPSFLGDTLPTVAMQPVQVAGKPIQVALKEQITGAILPQAQTILLVLTTVLFTFISLHQVNVALQASSTLE